LSLVSLSMIGLVDAMRLATIFICILFVCSMNLVPRD
jgi:hypothetical protein